VPPGRRELTGADGGSDAIAILEDLNVHRNGARTYMVPELICSRRLCSSFVYRSVADHIGQRGNRALARNTARSSAAHMLLQTAVSCRGMFNDSWLSDFRDKQRPLGSDRLGADAAPEHAQVV
jgi:hypothetical protein